MNVKMSALLKVGLVFLVYLCSYSGAIPALTEAQIEQVGKAMANMCISSSGVQRSLITKAMKGEIEDDRKLKCFFGCIMEAVQVTKNGRMQPEVLKRRANAMLPKTMREMILPTIDSCSHIENEDKCELAYSIVKCHFSVNGKNPFFFNF
uniref:Odorant binding protein 1 n=1 Tax=Laodelphax striatellus TaxID=195883 RepID=A0A096W1L5_LAOST|nr:odorant binding protein 1 [Laodelphax striatellus]